MVNNQLLDYIKQQLSLNIGREVITANLKSQGWTDADVHEAFSAIVPVTMPSTAPISPVVSAMAPSVAQIQPVQPVQQAQPVFSAPHVTMGQPINYAQPVHKSKKIIPIIVILILLLLAGGAAAYAYYTGFFVTLPGLLSESMDKSRATTSATYDTNFNVDFSEIKLTEDEVNYLSSFGINSRQIIFTAKGSSDNSDSKNPKISSVLSLSLGSLSLAAELRVVNNTFYAMLSKIPALYFLPIATSEYENKWFSFPIESVDGQTESIPLSMVSPVNPNISINLTTEQKDYLYQMTKDAHFIKTVKKLSSETVGGESSYHFTFDLDREGVVAYLQLVKDYTDTIIKDNPSFSSLDSISVTKELDKLKNFQGEIWIGRNDKLIHKIVINFGIQPDLAKNEQIKFNISAIFSDYNQPVSITAPLESISFQTLMEASLGEARQKGREAAIKANLANLRVQAEIFWDSNKSAYSGFCASKELKDIQKAVENSGGTEFFCKTTAKAHAIAAKLSDNSGYWCVDSTGASKSTTTLPSGTVCPVK